LGTISIQNRPASNARNAGLSTIIERHAWQFPQAMLSWTPKEKPYMTIHLPEPLQADILAAVHSGRYASLDDAMTDAASLLVQRLKILMKVAGKTG
jgi:hypothetical protein